MCMDGAAIAQTTVSHKGQMLIRAISRNPAKESHYTGMATMVNSPGCCAKGDICEPHNCSDAKATPQVAVIGLGRSQKGETRDIQGSTPDIVRVETRHRTTP